MKYQDWIKEFNSDTNKQRYNEYLTRHKFPVEYKVWFRMLGGFPDPTF